jgi:hypothetical protein
MSTTDLEELDGINTSTSTTAKLNAAGTMNGVNGDGNGEGLIKTSRVIVKKQKSTTGSNIIPVPPQPNQHTKRSSSVGSTGSVESTGSNSSTGSGKLRPPPVRRGSHRSSPSNSSTRLSPPAVASNPRNDFELGCKYSIGSDGVKVDIALAVAHLQRSADSGMTYSYMEYPLPPFFFRFLPRVFSAC